MNGNFDDFLAALLAFESGWDRERYDNGIIADWQLDQWAGGSVETLFPQYSSWSELSDAEWTSMAYKSTNTLGFVGFQFGEALLIDLGYYDDDFFYGNGASINSWDGSWTWRQVFPSGTAPLGRHSHAAALVAGRIVIFGGYSASFPNYMDDVSRAPAAPVLR